MDPFRSRSAVRAPTATDWLLDGNDNNELTAGGIAILPSIDAIQEFKVLTYNYSAEWGTRAGPTVLGNHQNPEPTSSTAPLSNSSATPLSMRAASSRPLPKSSTSINSAVPLGGPIRKDKTFFFADIQNKISASRHTLHRLGS